MKILKRKILAALLALSLLASLLPLGAQPAQAAAPNGQVIYVGNENVTSGGYWTTDSAGTVTAFTGEGTPADNFIYYDASRNTLTLHNATIRMSVSIDTNTLLAGAAIGVLNQYGDGNAELTITLEGTNTIAEVGKGIFVLANSASTGSSNLTIQGYGSLNASASQTGIWFQSNSKNAALCVENAEVTASSGVAFKNGVLVQAKDGSDVSLTVNGGSLTASVNANIWFQFGSGTSGSGTPTVTVSNNAIVRANGGITNNSSSPIQYETGSDSTGGIVWNGKDGTVYGKVELKEDLEIGEGESLTIGDGASLTVPNGKTLTNNGTVTTEGGGTLTNNGKIDNSGTLPETISGKQLPEITTASLPNGEVDKNYSQILASDNNPTSWSVTSGSLPAGLTMNESTGEISGIPTTAEESTFTVTATNDSGSDSKAFILTVTQPVTSVTLDKNTLELYTGSSENLTATVAPDNATNKTVTWSSSDNTVATVDNNGNVTAVKEGTATITATAADGSGCSATCTVTVTDKIYTISADPTALNFGSAYTGYSQPAAQTVTLTNTGNQQVTVTLPTANDFIITAGTGFTDGSAAIKPGETATFTVQPKAGLSAGTYSDTIAVTGNGGVTSSITASFTVKSQPPTIPPTVSEKTIDAIQDAEPGETVTVDLSHGSTKLDKEVFETLAGQDITLVIDLGDDLSWTVNGKDIPDDAALADLDLGVNLDTHGIPVNVINAITGEVGTVQITLAHDGEFGFTMTLTAPLGKENAGYWANLYHYDEDAEALNFEAAAKIDEDGSVTIPFSHASQYAIVIDTHSHATVDVSDIFIDVAPNAWYKDAVQYAYAGGLMTGVSDTEFAPEATTTRAMIVSILARLEGVESAQAAGFADVDDNDWYATAVNWAASVGVVNGYEDNTFQPNTAITREQLAAILMNYAAYKGEDVSNRADLTSYTDQPSTWAKETMSWAVAEGLITGVTADTLQPQGAATRAQVAAILQRFLSE